MTELYDRILGSLYTAAMGDALGAPTETMSAAEIGHYYGGRVTFFVDGAVNPAFHNARVGEISDDTSQLYEMARAVIASGGSFTEEDAAQALLNWADRYPRYYPVCAGPTTRNVIDELRSGKKAVEVGKSRGIGMPERGCSNGAAMHVAPAGLIHPGDPAGALETAITMTRVSHGTQIGYASACAVACAVAQALSPERDVYQVVRAALYGAKEGERRGMLEGTSAPGASVYSRIHKAIGIVYDCETMEEAERRLDERLGGDSSAAAPAVAIAVGLFAAADGDPIKTIVSAANVGGDTDTIGCIAGAIAGAYAGYTALPENWCSFFEQANRDIPLEPIARGLCEIAELMI